ncbi:hypothetical protein BAE44_0016371, partial [Dichanthelium oligosanthes]
LPPEEQMATCDPELLTMEITNDIEFLVIISDGVWGCFESQTVVDYIRFYLKNGRNDLRAICEKLCDRTMVSSDNVTAILVQFKDAPPPQPPPAPHAQLPAPPSAPEEKEEHEDIGPSVVSENQPLLRDR